eukprot:10193012-Alexandrium_andersonii.AAC.1
MLGAHAVGARKSKQSRMRASRHRRQAVKTRTVSGKPRVSKGEPSGNPETASDDLMPKRLLSPSQRGDPRPPTSDATEKQQANLGAEILFQSAHMIDLFCQ